MPEWQHERRGTTEDDDHPDDAPGTPAGPPAPFPALINLTVPGRQHLRLVRRPRRGRQLGTDRPRRHPPPGPGRLAASPHPLVLHPPRARRHRGRARLRPRPAPLDPAAARRQRNRDGPDARQAAALADLLRDLNVTFTPIAKGSCDHAQRRRPLHPQPQAQAPDPRPHRDLPRTRLRRAGLPQRPRPHPRLPRRDHLPVRPGPALPPPPPGQASPRLDAHPARTRRHALDHALRTQLHHRPTVYDA